MTEDGYPGYPGYTDLTPGNFMAKDKIEVNLDSLGEFGRGYFNETTSVFGVSMGPPIGHIKTDYGKAMGERTFGNSEEFHEAVTVADYLSSKGGAAESAEKLTQDLLYGNIALANVAMVMAEKYGVTDGFNAAKTADAVSGAFAPPKGSGLAKEWAEANSERAENNRKVFLPVVNPSDVHLYSAAGMVAGEDFTIASAPAQGPEHFEAATDGDMRNGEDTTPDNEDTDKKESGNPYYLIDAEDDYDQNRGPYVPPTVEDDTRTVAPGPLGQPTANTPGNDTGTVV